MIYGCGNCLIRRSVFARLEESMFDLRFQFFSVAAIPTSSCVAVVPG